MNAQLGEYRRWLVPTIVGLFLLLYSPGLAQKPLAPCPLGNGITRPLTVWPDTLQLSFCGDSTFVLSVWAGSFTEQDTVIGFRQVDSLVAMELVIWWDKSRFDFTPEIETSGTLIGQAREKSFQIDPNGEGNMFVSMVNPDCKIIFNPGPGGGIELPLLKLKGRITSSETFDGLNGWVEVRAVTAIESSTKYEPRETGLGFVHVVRDTSFDFTGVMGVTTGDFDTLQTDTIDLYIENVTDQRVRRISFKLASEPDEDYYVFADTLEVGTLSAEMIWDTKEVEITPDSIVGTFEASGDLTAEGPLLKIVVQRSDSNGFSSPVRVKDFSVNDETCLGKLLTEDGILFAATIPKDTADTSVSNVDRSSHADNDLTVIPGEVGSDLRVISSGQIGTPEVAVFNMLGRTVEIRDVERVGGTALRISFVEPLHSGPYFLVLQNGNNIVYKQFKVIK